MAKKYSVQMENDKIVSVEVDGVAYPNPEDIPNPQDRTKIKALMARTARANSKEGFDDDLELEFANEVRAMENQIFIVPKLMAAIFLSIAAITLTIAAFSTFGAIQTLFKEKSAPGRVVNLVTRTSADSSSGAVTEYTYPVVEFAPSGQPLWRVQMMEGSSSPEYAVGDPVTVLYDPQQPRDARIKSFASNLLLWLLPVVTFIVGVTFGSVALVLLKIWPRKKMDGLS